MPTPSDGETREHFMERCIPMVMNDGAAENNDMAVAMCANIWKQEHEPEGKAKMEFSNPIQILEFKANDDWLVEGYVSTFGTVDLGHDVVMPGAFKATLKSGPKVRFLRSHDPDLILGVPKKLKEDSKGLFGSFKISKTKLGEETRELLLDGAMDSFSFGYKAVDWAIVDEDVRQLKAVELYEASLVSIPMNQDATVTRVKEFTGTLAERASAMSAELQALLNDLRGLVDTIDRPLSETKRKEIEQLLEQCSGLDAVRTDLSSVLSAAPTSLVGQRLIKHLMTEKRKKYASQGE